MPKKRDTKRKTKSTARDHRAARSSTSSRSLYADYVIWEKKSRPKWHPVKKMRYVFFRMIDGVTISDAIKEIRWQSSEFWALIDRERNDVFRDEFLRVKKLQGRAFADSVVMIAEGRDRTTKMSVKTMRNLVKKGLHRARRQKNLIGAKMVIESLLAQIDHNEHRILGRNKLQMDAAKWIAKTSNPAEFSETSKLSLGSPPDGEGKEQAPLRIQFIGPDGKVVKP